MALVYSLISTFLVSLISFVGALALVIKGVLLQEVLFCLVAFSAGTMIGGAFLHLLPEALEMMPPEAVFIYLLAGFTFFFLLEKYLYWRHCHEGHCDVHTFSYLNLIGDGFHNFLDGLVIAGAFSVSPKIGVITTIAVVFHEIPQELGDFGVLIYGGFTKGKALFFNFLSGLTAMVGALVGYFLVQAVSGMSVFFLSLTAGGFLYVASSDLIPELHKQKGFRRSTVSFLIFVAGLVFMWFTKRMGA